MIERLTWCADDLDYDDGYLEEGRAWSSDGGDATIPDIKRPIGFIRRKPVIRVKSRFATHNQGLVMSANDAATVAHEIRAFLETTMKDQGTEIDSGSGMGAADLWAVIDGMEYHIQVHAPRSVT